MTDYNAQGCTFKIGDGASPEVFTAVASAQVIGDFGYDRTKLPTTKLSATNATSKPGLINYPDIPLEGTYDPADAQLDTLLTKVATDDQADTNFQIELDTSPAETWAFAGYLQAFMITGATVDGLLKFRANLSVNSLSNS